MMELDPFLLSRIQFATNISFHILFPSITIGLAWLLLYFRVSYTLTRDKIWEYAYFFWVKIFALTFALGVVSGITMSFQFGTNWPGFMERTGNISGPLLGYEVLTAFFLEASFLGIMLFGKSRVSNRTHLIATALVAIGTSLSAFWILSLNSWMQTPTGHIIQDNIFYADNWMDIIFNPSFPYRMTHMLLASLLTALFFVSGVSAWRILQQVEGPATWKILKTCILIAAIVTPIQILVGDLHGLNTLEHQPAKIAAIEAIWETQKGAPLTLFGFPDEDTQQTYLAIKIPYAASLILKHDMHSEIQGINDFKDNHPPVAIVFYAFRVMVIIGCLMLLCAWWGVWLLYVKKATSTLFLHIMSWMTYSGWVAVLSGWFVNEIGRQPWLVYGLLRSAEVVAEHSSATLLGTLFGYIGLYIFLLFSYIATIRHLATKPARSLEILVDVPAFNRPVKH